MFKARGSPSRPRETGSLRRRPRDSPYTEVAARSLIDLPRAITYREPYEGVHLPSAKAFEPAQREVFNPLTLRSSHALDTTTCMRQYLLHNLMFTYGIDPDYFRNHLHNAGCDLLSLAEKDYMFALGRHLQLLYERVRNNRYSLLVTEECSRLVEDVVVPAHNLNIEPGYLCEQLIRFPDHNFDKKKRDNTHIFSQTTRKGFWKGLRKWDTKEVRAHLVRCLVSDDYVVERIAPAPQVRVLIKTNIKSFSEKYCKKDADMGDVDRMIHVSEDMQRMLDVVLLRAQIHEQDQQQRNRIPASLYQPPVLLGHKRSIRRNGTPLADLNSVLETEPDRTH